MKRGGKGTRTENKKIRDKERRNEKDNIRTGFRSFWTSLDLPTCLRLFLKEQGKETKRKGRAKEGKENQRK